MTKFKVSKCWVVVFHEGEKFKIVCVDSAKEHAEKGEKFLNSGEKEKHYSVIETEYYEPIEKNKGAK